MVAPNRFLTWLGILDIPAPFAVPFPSPATWATDRMAQVSASASPLAAATNMYILESLDGVCVCIYIYVHCDEIDIYIYTPVAHNYNAFKELQNWDRIYYW